MVKLSHLDSRGRARMVDVGHKPLSTRRAVASALVVLAKETLEQVWNGGLEKGDALAVARLAGIQGAKQTPFLIPLCHPLPLDRVGIELRLYPEKSAICIFAEARTRAATGVEMEALTGAAVAALALIDMVKGIDREAHLAELKLQIKEGGSSGRWARDGHEDPFSRGERSGPDSSRGDKSGPGGSRGEKPSPERLHRTPAHRENEPNRPQAPNPGPPNPIPTPRDHKPHPAFGKAGTDRVRPGRRTARRKRER